MAIKTHCGFVAIVGRANVGKSTLFNALLDKQLSIATHKPQTTRHNIRGILSLDACQLILVDTPGIQLGNKRLINKVLISNALSSLQEVDVVLMVAEMGRWSNEDDYLLKQIKQVNRPVVLVINKIDRMKDKSALFPILEDVKSRYEFEDIIPISALHDKNMNTLTKVLCSQVPESVFLFPEDVTWDRDDAFVISEIVRGAAITQLHKELPYAIYTEVENLNFEEDLVSVGVVLWVEKDSQKGIVIGKKGSKLKSIGEQARNRLERVFGKKVMLKTWVKVKQNWQDQQDIVSQFKE
ncbi:MAG: GTPase Era [Gammaproteobacteria bacterium]|nr:GTPase Era [Gammaproteobacteria bacterium]NNC67443.1 GTPase Era [Gammaproteobacteria bacterium]